MFLLITISTCFGLKDGQELRPKYVAGTFNDNIVHQVVIIKYYVRNIVASAPGSSVGIATSYGLDGPSNPGGGGRRRRDFPPVQTCPGAHPASCKMGIGSFLGVKCGRGVLLTTHPLLVPRSWKSSAIPLPTLWAIPGL